MEKKKNFEMHIYEFLGVNIFRKYILFTLEKIAKSIKISDLGYRINKFDIEELNKYKTNIINFAKIHLLLLIFAPFIQIIIFHVSLSSAAFIIVVHIYCIMTQRYNYIRIKPIIEKMMPQIKKQIKQIDSSLISHKYVITNTNGKEKEISFEDLIAKATPEQLIEYRRYLLQFREIDNPPSPEDMPESIIYQQSSKLAHGKRRSLELKFRPNNSNSANY